MVGAAGGVQLLVRRTRSSGRNNRGGDSAVPARDARAIGQPVVSAEHPARSRRVGDPSGYCRVAVLDRAYSVARSAARQGIVADARRLGRPVVDVRDGGGGTFLEGIPLGL